MAADDGPRLPGEPLDGPIDPYETQALYVSARLLEDDDAAVGVVVFDPDDAGRVLGDGRTVSGWSAFVGDETPDELGDPQRIRIPSLGWFLQRVPAMRPVVDEHDGTEASWVRGDDGRLIPADG